MAINMMCMNSKCVHYWEDNCIRNLNEERIEINENGMCETFKLGTNPAYEHEERLKMSIEELDVTVRSYNCLKRSGINTVGDLIEKSMDDLEHIRNMSSKCVEEIVGLLGEHGLDLRKDG